MGHLNKYFRLKSPLHTGCVIKYNSHWVLSAAATTPQLIHALKNALAEFIRHDNWTAAWQSASPKQKSDCEKLDFTLNLGHAGSPIHHLHARPLWLNFCTHRHYIISHDVNLTMSRMNAHTPTSGPSSYPCVVFFSCRTARAEIKIAACFILLLLPLLMMKRVSI